MGIISVANLNHAFGYKEIFRDAEFKLLKNEHVGLIGANGRGKSTFMKILANKFSPNQCDLYINPKYRIGYMDQHTELKSNTTIFDTLKSSFNWMIELENEMVGIYEKYEQFDGQKQEEMLERAGDIQNILAYNGYYEIEEKIKYVASGLGINTFGYDTLVDSLSGGQRTKILLCKLLLENPDVLMLDEPTNFLDKEHVEWLRQYLLKYENAFVLISHDLDFLNSLVTIVYNFENFQIKRYKGNYDNFLSVYELEKTQLVKSYNRQQDDIKKTESFIAKNKARASTASRAQSRQKLLDKLERVELPPTNKPSNFSFAEYKSPTKIVLQVSEVVIGYSKPLSKPITFDVIRGDKIVITGANGIGKTTLLKTLIKEIPSLSGKIEIGDYVKFGYFKQEEKYPQISTYDYALEHFPYDKKTQQYIRKELARVGLNRENIDNNIPKLSGGEQAKLRLSILMNNEYNVLVLDEPTNHLDKESKKNLKQALIDYQGTMILVCHEPEFYDGLVTQEYDASDWVADK
ncbi:MAG: ABC-F family ATP-binding cassette domain-containing protein [Malacoplasma sp.]